MYQIFRFVLNTHLLLNIIVKLNEKMTKNILVISHSYFKKSKFDTPK